MDTPFHCIKTLKHLTPGLEQRLFELWEASVRATHTFLTEADIEAIKPLVPDALKSVNLLVFYKGQEPAGFLGLHGTKIEMLFVSPQHRGTGIGRALVERAINCYGARLVDVNEQNTQGVGFYQQLGFAVFDRSALDGQGNPFPLLHMELPPAQ